jgi:glycosyltransferase involved in cell wall biosynthesis
VSVALSHPHAIHPENQLVQSAMPWQDAAESRLSQNDLPRLPDGVGLSVVFPAYNDAHTIGALIDYSARLLEQVATDFEILVVNDGSEDATGEVLTQRQSLYPFLRVVTHPKNQGYGAALRSGFGNASKSLVFYTDGDGQYDPTELLLLLPALGENALVNGYKRQRSDSILRKIVGRAYHHAARLLFRLPIRDTDCDFRLMRRDVLSSLTLTSDSGAICPELVWQMKHSRMPIAEVGVGHYPRVSGSSQFFRLPRIWASLKKLLVLWWQLVLSPFGGRVLRALGLRR